MVHGPLSSWPKSLDFAIPLFAVTNRSRDNLVEKALAEVPSATGTIVEALMWLRCGRLEPAHTIVQDAERGVAAYAHGMLHRMEGDFWNANYWFRRVRDPMLEIHIQKAFRDHSDPTKPWKHFFQNGGFDPVRFTEACERWHGDRGTKKNATEAELQGIASIEWEAVWENALNSLS
jgi:hypothetical protein